MEDNWQSAYSRLQDFVVTHPSIVIDASCVVLPDEVRPEFYRLFDAVRSRFIEGRYPASLQKADELALHFRDISASLKASGVIESVEASSDCQPFLDDPRRVLQSLLFDPLFDVLKGKTDVTGFGNTASHLLNDAFQAYLKEGYQRWATLALISSFQPDKIWRGQNATYEPSPASSEGDSFPGGPDEEPPVPIETNRLYFDKNSYCNFLVPQVILHSQPLNKFVSFGTDLFEPRRKSPVLGASMEWLRLIDIKQKVSGRFWPDMALYFGDQAENLSLIADCYHVARPDVLIEFMEEESWYLTSRIESVIEHYKMFRPRHGSYVICYGALTEDAGNQINLRLATAFAAVDGTATVTPGIPVHAVKIYPLSVGYDSGSVKTIVDRMRDQAIATEANQSGLK
jgi:hypothetical protein